MGREREAPRALPPASSESRCFVRVWERGSQSGAHCDRCRIERSRRALSLYLIHGEPHVLPSRVCRRCPRLLLPLGGGGRRRRGVSTRGDLRSARTHARGRRGLLRPCSSRRPLVHRSSAGIALAAVVDAPVAMCVARDARLQDVRARTPSEGRGLSDAGGRGGEIESHYTRAFLRMRHTASAAWACVRSLWRERGRHIAQENGGREA